MNADPCIFAKNTPEGSINAGITNDEFLQSETTNGIIEDFTAMLQQKCTVRDLGPDQNISDA